MATLIEVIGAEPTRAAFITECVDLIDAQVKTKGFMVKGAYVAIKAIKRRFVPEVVDALLDEWLTRLQVHHDRWAATKPSTFPEFVIARSDEIAEDLLAVTDKRAEKTTHTTAKKYYFKMRDSAKRDVVDSIPELARMVDRYLAAHGAA